jgi:hypothetical protein
MPVANNMDELRNMLTKELEIAMREVSDAALGDMYAETGKFYSGRQPKEYVRTGALGNTPRVTTPKQLRTSRYTTEVSFDAYLDLSHDYTTGDRPGMEQVLLLASYGIPWQTASGAAARSTVGKRGFWQRAENKIENDLYKVMRRHFR